MKLETALLLIPPLPVQHFVAPIRARFAPASFPLVPAHITLMYPFVDYRESHAAADILRNHCLAIPPFDVSLARYGNFPAVVYIEPADPDPILQLYHSILQVFPDYVAYGGAYGQDLHPHMTIAERSAEIDLDAISLPVIPDLRFTVDRIYLYAGIVESDREGPVPFIPLSIIPLGRDDG